MSDISSDALSQGLDCNDQYGYVVNFRNPSPPSDGQPYLLIVEQPQSRGFRFRYECEGKSHGGLQGERSQKEAKKYPSVKLCNYRGAAKVTVTLVTDEETPRPHANLLIGKTCHNGVCTVHVKGEHQDPVISFPNLSIRHVTKKAVPGILMERMREALCVDKMMESGCLGQNIEQMQLTPAEELQLKEDAVLSAKNMPLNVVRLCFRAYLLDGNGVCTSMLPQVISNPIFDCKAPANAVLKINRMDKVGGSCLGNQEVFLLCDKVQKDDIAVRFYEEDGEGNVMWEGFGEFSPNDVHKQHAIVFRTPAYHKKDINDPVEVKVHLKRLSDGETSKCKKFKYCPCPSDPDDIQRKRMKTVGGTLEVATGFRQRAGTQRVQNMWQQTGSDPMNGRVPTPAAATAAPLNGNYVQFNQPGAMSRRLDEAPGQAYVQGRFVIVNQPIVPTTVTRTLQEDSVPVEEEFVGRSFTPPRQGSDQGRNSVINQQKLCAKVTGTLQEDSVPLEEEFFGHSFTPLDVSAKRQTTSSRQFQKQDLGPSPEKFVGPSCILPDVSTKSLTSSNRQFQEQETQTSETGSVATVLANALIELYKRTSLAIQDYSQTGDVCQLLMPTRHMIDSRNVDGDNAVHLSVIHSQPVALSNILSALSTLPSANAINGHNYRLQTPLQLAVATRQIDMVNLLLTHGAEPRIMFYQQRGDTVLHIAARNGDVACLELLLQYWNVAKKQTDDGKWYPDVDCMNFDGFSALHVAVRCGHVDCVRALVKTGRADINLRDGCCGRTALHHAVLTNKHDVVAHLILDCSADVDIPDDSGNTPLHFATISEQLDMAALLMAAGADPDAENCDYSSRDSDTDDVDDDVNPTETRNYQEDEQSDENQRHKHGGKTPRDLAEISNQVDMMRLLDGEEYVSIVSEKSHTSIVDEKLNSIESANSATSLPTATSLGAIQEAQLKSYIDSGIDSILDKLTLKSGDLSTVDAFTRTQLSKLLDPAKPGSDWRELAKRLKLQRSISGFERQKSPTTALLYSYEVADGTVEELINCLHAMNRRDAIELIQEKMLHI